MSGKAADIDAQNRACKKKGIGARRERQQILMRKIERAGKRR